jgi:hypothetical protein
MMKNINTCQDENNVTSKQIDQFVYQLYGLMEEEIGDERLNNGGVL